MSESILMTTPTTIEATFTVEDQNEGRQGTVTLRKLSLGKFHKLTMLIDDMLAKGYKINVQNIDSQAGAQALTSMLKDAPGTISAILCLVSDLTPELADEIEIESAIEVLLAAWKVNNLVKVFAAAVKKAKGLETPQA